MKPAPLPGFGPERFLEPDPVIELLRAEVDPSLIEANLRRTPEERVRRMLDMVRTVELLKGALPR